MSILIIGATSDIAQALAKQYAAQGKNLILAGRRVDAIERIAQDLRIAYRIEVQTVDFEAQHVTKHATWWANLSPKPQGVIWVAGYLGEQARAQSDWTESHAILMSNYVGAVALLNAVSQTYFEQKHGFIVGISSVAGDRGRQSNFIYGSAKAGFTAYLSGLRNLLAQVGVPVLTVKPGFVATQMTANLNLPAKLTATPEQAARDIIRAQQAGKNVLYTRWFWRWIMLIIKHIPESIFKKLKL